MIILVGVPTASVIYSGAKVICVFFQGYTLLGLDLSNITVGCWIIGVLAAVYVFAGGLKACAWADLIQGSALIVGGGIVMYLALDKLGAADPAALVATAASPEITADTLSGLGAWGRFWTLNDAALPEGKLHMVRQATDPSIPWTALVVGLWIPNFFYWGLNQYITQRTLGSKSLKEGQRGVVFAALLKLVIPFVVVIPGILAFNLFSDDLRQLAAEQKNKTPLAELAAGKEQIYHFGNRFAKIEPELAGKILAFNAKLLGEPAPEVKDPAAMLAVLGAQLKAAEAKKLPKSQKIVGYDFDAAFPTLLRNLLPQGKASNGLAGFVLAAIFGAVVSSIAAMLNAASTIFASDIWRKLRRKSTDYELVTVGRVSIVVFVLLSIIIAPKLDNPKFGGIFTFIQEFQGFISPGILGIFIFGVLVHKAPRICGTVGLVLSPVAYGALMVMAPQIAFLNRMAIVFALVLVTLAAITVAKPLPVPVNLPVNPKMDMTSSRSTKIFGLVVVVLTLVLYAIFW